MPLSLPLLFRGKKRAKRRAEIAERGGGMEGNIGKERRAEGNRQTA